MIGSHGRGGEGRHHDSSHLGGGWGGGGAGGDTGHGGGGAGSYAIKSTHGGKVPSGSPGTKNGAVEVGFLIP